MTPIENIRMRRQLVTEAEELLAGARRMFRPSKYYAIAGFCVWLYGIFAESVSLITCAAIMFGVEHFMLARHRVIMSSVEDRLEKCRALTLEYYRAFTS